MKVDFGSNSCFLPVAALQYVLLSTIVSADTCLEFIARMIPTNSHFRVIYFRTHAMVHLFIVFTLSCVSIFIFVHRNIPLALHGWFQNLRMQTMDNEMHPQRWFAHFCKGVFFFKKKESASHPTLTVVREPQGLDHFLAHLGMKIWKNTIKWFESQK